MCLCMNSCLDCRSGSEFVTWYVTTHTWMSLLKVCEGSVESGGIAVTPTLKDFRNEVALAHVVRWLHMILTSLDCYIWLFGEGLVRPSLLLKTESLGNMSKARYNKCINYTQMFDIQSGECYKKIQDKIHNIVMYTLQQKPNASIFLRAKIGIDVSVQLGS